MNKKTRLFFLDAARGFCMLLVILGHIWETDGLLPVLIYSFHIPLFFIISGILLKYTQTADRPAGMIILSRLKSLIIPYIFFEFIFTAIYGILNHFDFRGQNIFGGLLLNPLNVPLWFLPTLFLSELLIILLLKAEKSGRLMTAAAIFLYLIPFFVKDSGNPLLSAAMRCCSSVGFTALGYVGCGLILKISPHPVLLVILTGLDGILALINGKVGIYKLTFGNPFLFTVCAVTGSFIILSVLKRVRIRVFEWIGANTLVLLGLHIIALRVVQLIPGLDTDTFIGGLAAMLLVCALLTPAVLFINRFLPFLAGKKYSSSFICGTPDISS